MLKQYHYDQDKNLTGLFVQSGNAILANNRYLYDGNGNRTHKKQLGDETLYHYDPLNQLQKVQYPGYTEELFYDKAGNRTRRIAQGVEEFYQYDPRNRLTAYTKNGTTTLFRYDHAGNLLADDKARYSYDAFNRTTRVETFDGNIQVNRYDAEGLRHEMEENGSLVKFIFNPDREAVVEESRSSLTRYIRSSELIARNTDAARTYYHYVSDEMGSTTHIVDEDGIVFNHYDYDAWGNLTAQEEAVPNRFKFTGQQLDSVTQQYYLRARFYNPVIARFTQEDTYRGDGLNLYAYCQNNPVFYVDPSGNVSQCLKNAFDKYRQEGKNLNDAYKLAIRDYEIAQQQGVSIPAPKKPSNNAFKEYVEAEKKIQQKILWDSYLDDIEIQTGRKIPMNQRELVISEGINNNNNHVKLPKSESRMHRKNFNKEKDKLIKEWENNTNQTWPSTSTPTSRKYDAHEIIPNVYNSPLKWWNLHPAAFPNEHQSGIHRIKSPLYKIYPR